MAFSSGWAPRSFSHFLSDEGGSLEETNTSVGKDAKGKLLRKIDESVIGELHPIPSAFGSQRQLVYADYVASGRYLSFIEDFISSKVLPMYANTHSTASATGMQMTLLRHEARTAIKKSVNGNHRHAVLFQGNGATAAMSKLVSILRSNLIKGEWVRMPEQQRPIVFVGPFEHHSNLLCWRESGADVVVVAEDEVGAIDILDLKKKLSQNRNRRYKIGSFSAASNVTGITTNVDYISSILHKEGAIAIFDYACAGPYAKIDVSATSYTLPTTGEIIHDNGCYKDAVVISPHKFVGGPSSPGILIVSKKLFDIDEESVAPPAPSVVGGGTVFFVTDKDHRYLKNIEEREEGGTPGIVESIRCGLAFRLKDVVGVDVIRQKESALRERALKKWLRIPSLVLLGTSNVNVDSLAIFSFLIKAGDRFLHYNFVAALLNDLFGIQSRGGCMCAGPYAQRLLGISYEQAKLFEKELVDTRSEILRPGFTRLNLPYFTSNEKADFIIRAVEFVATHGWRFVPFYRFHIETGEWRHRSLGPRQILGRVWLGDLTFFNEKNLTDCGTRNDVLSFQECLSLALELSNDAASIIQESGWVPHADTAGLRDERLRWFVLPYESFTALSEGKLSPSKFLANSAPFSPGREHDSLDMNNNILEDHLGATGDKECRPTAVQVDGNRALEIVRQPSFSIPSPDLKVIRLIGKAIKEFAMIKEGDRILIGISGGKDSLSLLHFLLFMQRKSPVKYHIGCATVDPMNDAFDPSPLKKYIPSLGVPYFFETQNVFDRAAKHLSQQRPSICSFCSRMRRGILYAAARREGYNVLALAQHADDLAESFMMSVLHNGLLRTMKAHYTEGNGEIRVIRPLVYVREKQLRQYADKACLPVIEDNCPACYEEPKERKRMKKLIASQEAVFPDVMSNLLKAMGPLIAEGASAP